MSAPPPTADYVRRYAEEIQARVNARRARFSAAGAAIAATPEPPRLPEPSIARVDPPRSPSPPVAPARHVISAAELAGLAHRGDVTAKHPDMHFAPSARHDQAREIMRALPDVNYVEALRLASAAREGEDIKALAQRVSLAGRGDPVARHPDKQWAKSPVHDRARALMLTDRELTYREALTLVWRGSKS